MYKICPCGKTALVSRKHGFIFYCPSFTLLVTDQKPHEVQKFLSSISLEATTMPSDEFVLEGASIL